MNRYLKLSIILLSIFIVVNCVFLLTKDTKYQLKTGVSVGVSVLISCLIMILYVVYIDREDIVTYIDTGDKKHVLLGEFQPKYMPDV